MQLCISDRWCQPTYAFSSRNDGHCMLLCRPKAAGPALIYHACSTIQEPSIATHHQQILHVLLFLLSFCFLSSLGALSDLSLSMSVSLCRHTHTRESPQLFAVAHLPAVPAASANRGCTQPIHCMVYKARADNIYYVIFFMPR